MTQKKAFWQSNLGKKSSGYNHTLKLGVMDLEEARRLLKESVRRIYQMNNAL